ncbi:TniB family NTP-binding protein [Streptomyces sp. NPDC101152]|uniref:TniB family NTP-binding protein n=1 Tax=Streptomyces sp. NPDC101152 TaxID=3366116 RepID=UPI00380F80EB
MICEFYGHPASERASAAALASHALDCVLNCETRLGIIDDIHFIDLDRKEGLAVSNHLKWLANELPVTFVYVGVGLAERRFFADGLTGKNTVLAQTARRWTRLSVDPFRLTSDQGRQHWRSLLKATERQLMLAEHRPGMLTELAGYLFERTSGHIGSYFTLLMRGCYRAIRASSEALDRDLLDQVRLDEASEQARKQLAAALTHGTLSATIETAS